MKNILIGLVILGVIGSAFSDDTDSGDSKCDRLARDAVSLRESVNEYARKESAANANGNYGDMMSYTKMRKEKTEEYNKVNAKLRSCSAE